MKQKHRFWLLIAISVILIAAGFVWTLPEYEIRHLGARLNATDDAREAAGIVQQLLMSNRRSALDIVVDYANASPLRDIDVEHKYMMIHDPNTEETFELCGFPKLAEFQYSQQTRIEDFKAWFGYPGPSDSSTSWASKGGKYEEIRVVESIPGAVTFLMKQPGSKRHELRIQSFKNMMLGLDSADYAVREDELEELRKTGIFKRFGKNFR